MLTISGCANNVRNVLLTEIKSLISVTWSLAKWPKPGNFLIYCTCSIERTFSESKQTFLEKLDCRRHVPEEEEQSKKNFQALLNLFGWQINQHRWDWIETLDPMGNMSRNWKLYIKGDERSNEHNWLIKVGRSKGELQRAETVTTKWKSRRRLTINPSEFRRKLV